MQMRSRCCSFLAVLALGLGLAVAGLFAQPSQRVVYVAPIEGMIDLGLAPYVKRVIEQAEREGAAAVVLEVNTFGGRVDAAVQIRDTLLNAKVPTVAFINKRAISAGALISLAAEKIAIGTGGTIGAATPVQAGQPGAGAQPVEEKTVSYVRKEFRATAESRKRPPLIAEAMVDADVAISGVTTKGKLLTLTTEEAIKLKVADFRADSLEEVLKNLGLEGAEIRQDAPNWAENIVRFLTHPVVSSLLITIAMVGILIELRTPGFGVPGIAGVTSLGLFLWGHWIVQLAGWEELLIVAIGVALLAVELIFLPGFGIAGIAGIVAILAGLIMSMLGEGNAPQMILLTTGRVALALVIAVALLFVFMRSLPKFSLGRRLVLDTELTTEQGFASAPESDSRWLGKVGKAATPLHPAGIADIDEQRVDVVSEGELIDAGELIKVVRVDGNRVVVRRHHHS
jgi:membrane-bound serine protease (ClpP class)